MSSATVYRSSPVSNSLIMHRLLVYSRTSVLDIGACVISSRTIILQHEAQYYLQRHRTAGPRSCGKQAPAHDTDSDLLGAFAQPPILLKTKEASKTRMRVDRPWKGNDNRTNWHAWCADEGICLCPWLVSIADARFRPSGICVFLKVLMLRRLSFKVESPQMNNKNQELSVRNSAGSMDADRITKFISRFETNSPDRVTRYD